MLSVRDLDEATTKEELVEALEALTGEKATIEVRGLRPAYGGTQVATVMASPEHARKLIDKSEAGRLWTSASAAGSQATLQGTAKEWTGHGSATIAAERGTRPESARPRHTARCAERKDTGQRPVSVNREGRRVTGSRQDAKRTGRERRRRFLKSKYGASATGESK